MNMHWSLVLVFALLQRAKAEQTSRDGSSQALGHIVVLKEGLNDGHLNKDLDWVKSIHKRSLDSSNDNENQENGVKHTYHGSSYGFHGYAGIFSPDVLKNIKEHEHVRLECPILRYQYFCGVVCWMLICMMVDFVEEDQVIVLEPTKREENTDGDMLPEGGTRKKHKGTSDDLSINVFLNESTASLCFRLAWYTALSRFGFDHEQRRHSYTTAPLALRFLEGPNLPLFGYVARNMWSKVKGSDDEDAASSSGSMRD